MQTNFQESDDYRENDNLISISSNDEIHDIDLSSNQETNSIFHGYKTQEIKNSNIEITKSYNPNLYSINSPNSKDNEYYNKSQRPKFLVKLELYSNYLEK